MNSTTALRRLIAGLAVVGALALAGCGSNSKSSNTPSTSTPATTSTPASSGIPQGNVGDNDSDNHGAPSDGDGQL